MKLTRLDIQDVWLIEPKVHADDRGFFMEIYNHGAFKRNGLDLHFLQDNISRSGRGTLRGLHYQLAPHGMGKLVFCTEGEVFDVAVDIRRKSPSFGRWVSCVLSSENKKALYIPPGFAHGFCVLSDVATFQYKCTALFEPTADKGIFWNDPAIGIKWPISPNPALISTKDKNAPLLRDAENNF